MSLKLSATESNSVDGEDSPYRNSPDNIDYVKPIPHWRLALEGLIPHSNNLVLEIVFGPFFYIGDVSVTMWRCLVHRGKLRRGFKCDHPKVPDHPTVAYVSTLMYILLIFLVTV